MPGGIERQHSKTSEVDPKTLVDRGVEELLLGMKQGTSQRLEDYLAFTARFHHYSLSNQILIYIQYPQATYVAGYQTWKKLGYQVAKGEKGIRILAPRPYKRTDQETGKEEERISFAFVPVFDVSQLANLDQRPPPTFFRPLSDDQNVLFEKAAQAVREDGISLEEGWTGPAQGYSQGNRIVLQRGMDSRNRVLTLFHEYAHELLHWNEQGRKQPIQIKECHAEAVAFIVAYRFGVHNEYSADYLQSWGTTQETLKAELEQVRNAAEHIIERIESRLRDASSDNEVSGLAQGYLKK